MSHSDQSVSIGEVRSASEDLAEALREILLDAIAGGFSIGFLDEITADEADGFWASLIGDLGEHRRMWVARIEFSRQLPRVDQLVGYHSTHLSHRSWAEKMQARHRRQDFLPGKRRVGLLLV